MLLDRPQTDAADMLAFPIANVVVLFIALYGSRLELILGVGIIGLLFGLPVPGKPYYFDESVRDVIIASLTGVVAVSVYQVVTVMRRQQAIIEHQAMHDGLTGLPNRNLLEDRLAQNLAQAARSGEATAVLMLDFNRFKQVNDQLGHEVGDRLLCEISQRLTGALRKTDTVARLGGDEFVILLSGVQSVHDAVLVAEKILAATAPPVIINGHVLTPGVSIGIALYGEHGADAECLLRHADAAMYRAKRSGSGYQVAPGAGLNAAA
jgi:diguanylate cyclase (GGDEF)-like protein